LDAFAAAFAAAFTAAFAAAPAAAVATTAAASAATAAVWCACTASVVVSNRSASCEPRSAHASYRSASSAPCALAAPSSCAAGVLRSSAWIALTRAMILAICLSPSPVISSRSAECAVCTDALVAICRSHRVGREKLTSRRRLDFTSSCCTLARHRAGPAQMTNELLFVAASLAADDIIAVSPM
jgi:hypothetical protein